MLFFDLCKCYELLLIADVSAPKLRYIDAEGAGIAGECVLAFLKSPYTCRPTSSSLHST